MILNPYNFKKYLRPVPMDPVVGGWVLFAFFLAFLVFWSSPYRVPNAISVNLPKAQSATLKTPPSVFAVYTAKGIIYNNRLLTLSGFWDTIKLLPNKETLLLATESQTPLSELLPILQKAESLGFKDVSFTIKP